MAIRSELVYKADWKHISTRLDEYLVKIQSQGFKVVSIYESKGGVDNDQAFIVVYDDGKKLS